MRRALCLALLLSSSCSDPVVSQVMVIVDADSRIRSQALSLVIRVSGGGRERDQVTGCTDGATCQVHREELPIDMLPFDGLRLALAPDGRDWRRLYEASVTAYDGPNGTGTALATTRVISGYVRGETRVIRLFLQGSCIGVDCDDPDLTCRGGECVDPFIPPATLDPFVPPDAGSRDGGVDAPMCALAGDCDDGVDCTFDDCVVGSCRFTPRDTSCSDPSNPCLDAVCDATDGCTTRPNTAACDDGNLCNGTDQCAAGSCSNIGPALCPAPLTCEADGRCTGCSGGDCPGTQECVGGTCVCDAVPSEVMEQSCDDLVDNDCDGLTDCADPGCVGLLVEVCDGGITDEDCDLRFDEGCFEDDCTNGADDDTDGFTDCDDPDCADRACRRAATSGFCSASLLGCCAIGLAEACGTTEDYDCDGIAMSDCMDGGLGDGAVPEAGSDAGTDADFDACGATEVCNNGIDDDCNGMMDCEDPVCDMMPCPSGTCIAMVCMPDGTETICDDSLDDDGDGFIDCEDEDCNGLTCGPGITCECTPVGDGSCSPGDCFGVIREDAGV